MPDRLSDDEVGRQILSIFARHKIAAGGALQRNYFFEVRDADFQRGINRAVASNWITIDLRNRYLLGYVPSDRERNGRYHLVEVKMVPPKGLPPVKAHWRTGYYAPTE